jgi:hypothetical protein
MGIRNGGELKRMGYEIVAEMFDEAAGEITGSEC